MFPFFAFLAMSHDPLSTEMPSEACLHPPAQFGEGRIEDGEETRGRKEWPEEPGAQCFSGSISVLLDSLLSLGALQEFHQKGKGRAGQTLNSPESTDLGAQAGDASSIPRQGCKQQKERTAIRVTEKELAVQGQGRERSRKLQNPEGGWERHNEDATRA
eukprot:756649-Hanusia_phi.AAC.4